MRFGVLFCNVGREKAFVFHPLSTPSFLGDSRARIRKGQHERLINTHSTGYRLDRVQRSSVFGNLQQEKGQVRRWFGGDARQRLKSSVGRPHTNAGRQSLPDKDDGPPQETNAT